jgi:ribA/ribD-fused uncharacterized protein
MTTTAKPILFYRVRDPYGAFSNFSPHPIMFDGTRWPTNEHYFQAQKFRDVEFRVKILKANSPMIAARLGRSRAWPLRPDWEQVKDDVMRKVVRAKACQHADVRELFLGTGDASIVEHSRWDAYWGDGGDGTGQNKLGRIFVEVRAELTKDGPFDELREILPPPWIKYPQIPRVSIGWRMGAGEGYMCEWGPWYGGLSEAGKRKYQAMFPAPAGEWADYWKDKSAKPKRPRKPR